MITLLLMFTVVAAEPEVESDEIQLGPAKRFANLDVLSTKNIFSPRSAPPPGQGGRRSAYRPPAPPPPPVEASYRFVGLAQLDERHFVLIDDEPNKAQYYYEQGESIGRAKLREVHPETWQILIEYQGAERIVSLGEALVDGQMVALGLAEGDPYSRADPDAVVQAASTGEAGTTPDAEPADTAKSVSSPPMSSRTLSVLERLKAARRKQVNGN